MVQVIENLKFCAPSLTATSLGRDTYFIFVSGKSSSFKTHRQPHMHSACMCHSFHAEEWLVVSYE